jgi:hypothetical protein
MVNVVVSKHAVILVQLGWMLKIVVKSFMGGVYLPGVVIEAAAYNDA